MEYCSPLARIHERLTVRDRSGFFLISAGESTFVFAASSFPELSSKDTLDSESFAVFDVTSHPDGTLINFADLDESVSDTVAGHSYDAAYGAVLKRDTLAIKINVCVEILMIYSKINLLKNK